MITEIKWVYDNESDPALERESEKGADIVCAARLKFVNFMRMRMWGGRELDMNAAGWTGEDMRIEVVRLLREFPQHHGRAKEFGVPDGDFRGEVPEPSPGKCDDDER